MTLRQAALAGNLFFLLLDGPGEWRDIAHSVLHPDAFYHWRLALGLTIRNVLVAGTIVGLWRNQRYGYICLLAGSLQSIVMRLGAFAAVETDALQHLAQLILPTVDIGFRIFCLVCFWNWNRREGAHAQA